MKLFLPCIKKLCLHILFCFRFSVPVPPHRSSVRCQHDILQPRSPPHTECQWRGTEQPAAGQHVTALPRLLRFPTGRWRRRRRITLPHTPRTIHRGQQQWSHSTATATRVVAATATTTATDFFHAWQWEFWRLFAWRGWGWQRGHVNSVPVIVTHANW